MWFWIANSVEMTGQKLYMLGWNKMFNITLGGAMSITSNYLCILHTWIYLQNDSLIIEIEMSSQAA